MNARCAPPAWPLSVTAHTPSSTDQIFSVRSAPPWQEMREWRNEGQVFNIMILLKFSFEKSFVFVLPTARPRRWEKSDMYGRLHDDHRGHAANEYRIRRNKHTFRLGVSKLTTRSWPSVPEHTDNAQSLGDRSNEKVCTMLEAN